MNQRYSTAMDLQDRTILVTGAAGFLGVNLIGALLSKDCRRVHAVVRSSQRGRRLAALASDLHLHTADLTYRDSILQIWDAVRPEIVFHLAAAGGASGSRDRHQVFESNVCAAHHLLLALARTPCARLIYTGGSVEYGPKPAAIREEDALTPVSFYAAAKAAATLLFQQAARHEGAPIVILRPFSIYGPHEPPHRLIPTAIRACRDGEVLPLTPAGYVRDFVFVDDVVEACLQAAVVDSAVGETLNIGTGVQTSNEEVVRCIEASMGRKLQLKLGATRRTRPILAAGGRISHARAAFWDGDPGIAFAKVSRRPSPGRSGERRSEPHEHAATSDGARFAGRAGVPECYLGGRTAPTSESGLRETRLLLGADLRQ